MKSGQISIRVVSLWAIVEGEAADSQLGVACCQEGATQRVGFQSEGKRQTNE